MALYHCLKNPDLQIQYLVTTINDASGRISMHGVRSELLIRQANSIGISLYQIRLPDTPGMTAYNEEMAKHMRKFKEEGITHAIYGDILLEDLKKYREDRLAEAGLQGIFPLWQRDTKELIAEFLDLGFETIIVCTQDRINSFVGKVIDWDLLSSLPEGVDICGENGEYHTFVFKGPVFEKPIGFEIGEKVYMEFAKPKDINDTCFLKQAVESKKDGYWYIDLL